MMSKQQMMIVTTNDDIKTIKDEEQAIDGDDDYNRR